MIVSDGIKKLEIKEWPLVEGMFYNWKHEVVDGIILVPELTELTSELRDWGISWRWM